MFSEPYMVHPPKMCKLLMVQGNQLVAGAGAGVAKKCWLDSWLQSALKGQGHRKQQLLASFMRVEEFNAGCVATPIN